MDYNEAYFNMAMYVLGLLPFISVNFNVASLGFITRNYHDDLITRAAADPTVMGRFGLRAY